MIHKLGSDSHTGPKFEILIVDDLEDNLLALNGILERDDLNIRKALSGQEALELMMKHEFCLAILDVKMPQMSGFELAELMRGTRKTRNIPIIFVTATATEQNFSFKGYESGAVDFLLKPLDVHAVKSKVNIFIELHRQQAELGQQLLTITHLLSDLRAAKTEAERANASKTEFLAHMSHEIRTPIGAILGFSELRKSPTNTPEENGFYTKIIERNSHQLLKLIDDILDLSKVEAGRIAIETIEFSLPDLLQDLHSAMSLRARAKDIEFRLNVMTEIPNKLNSDPCRLRQILDNVAGNAIKFTDHGFIELRVSYADSKLKFEFEDTGLGISDAQGAKLFQPFAQADISITRKYGGTGLGLVLSRKLAEALGGRLDLVSHGGRPGSTFVIEINAELLSTTMLVDADASVIRVPQKVVHKESHSLKGLEILLIEDSTDNQILITTYLKKEGAKVTCASDGASGVALALTGGFEIVLMDIQMPILDGHSATQKLRSTGYKKPIVALTAHAMNEEYHKCVASGFTDFLTKPIQRELLVSTLANLKLSSAAEASLERA